MYASDIDRSAIDSLMENRGVQVAQSTSFLADALIEQRDVSTQSGAEILAKLGMRRGDLELLAGGPPCQAWSSAGRQLGFADPRGQVAQEFVRLAAELSPRWILMENVRGLLTARDQQGHPGGALHNLRAMLLEHGYQTDVRLLNAADFGVAQRRVRLFVVGFRSSDAPPWPTATHAQAPSPLDEGVGKWRTMREALSFGWPISELEVIRPSSRLLGRLEELKPGTGLKSPGKVESTRPGGHWGYTQGAFVCDLDRPARTVTASAQQDWLRDPHWGLRRLTPRECATLQSFPGTWRVPASIQAAYRLVGNAVPPDLGHAVGTSLFRAAVEPVAVQNDLQGLAPLPQRLRAAIEYTIKEEHRNGASRRLRSPKRANPETMPLW